MRQLLLRSRFKVPIAILMAIISMLSFNCIEAPLNPVAPSSDIQLSIPLMDVRRYVENMMTKDTTSIKKESGGYYFSDTKGSIKAIDTIKVQPRPSAQQVTVGIFGVDSIPSISQNKTLNQLGISPGTYTGAPLPPFPSRYVSIRGDTLNFSSQFDYIAVNTGTLRLQIANNLPLRINFNRPIVLRNNQFQPNIDTSVIATFYVGVIDSFGTYDSTSSLDGRLLRAQLKFDSVSFTTEERSTSFSLESSNGISLQFSSSSLLADSATAKIPSQQITSIEDSVVSIDDSVVVQSAHFSSGSLQIALVNNLGIKVGVHFVIDEFVNNVNGNSFTIDTTMQGKQTISIPMNANQLHIQSTTASQFGTWLTFSVGIKTINSEGLKKNVTKDDFVRVSIVPGPPLVVHSITGKIKPTVVNINSPTFLNLGEAARKFKTDSLKFDSAKIKLNLTITGGFVTDYDLRLIAKNHTTRASVNIDIPPPTGSVLKRFFTGSQEIVLDNAAGTTKGFLDKFFAVVPDTLTLLGTITMNPVDVFNTSQGISSIADTSKIYNTVDVYFPVRVGIYGGKIIEVVDMGSGSKFPSGFVNNTKEGSMNFEFINRIPLEMRFRAALLRQLTPISPVDTLLWIPTDNVPRIVQPAKVDSNGIATDSVKSSFSITMTGAEMQKLQDADSISIRFDIQTSSYNSGYNPVHIQQDDFIRIRASANATFILNKP